MLRTLCEMSHEKKDKENISVENDVTNEASNLENKIVNHYPAMKSYLYGHPDYKPKKHGKNN